VSAAPVAQQAAPVRIADELNQGLHEAFERAENVLILGEDLHDPIGGAFRVTRGLSTRFPDRVIATPISEALIVGLCTGLALRGKRVVAEIMFGDFVLLAADQIINVAAKLHGMFHGQVNVPITIRVPMGGRRGYGATHSQSLEKHFLGVPGLGVVAVSPVHDNGAMLRTLILESEHPTLFVENKTFYGESGIPSAEHPVWSFETLGADVFAPRRARLRGVASSVATLVTYGGMTRACLDAAERLALEDELFCEVLVLARLAPLDRKGLLAAVPPGHAVIVAEEGPLSAGVGAELVATLAESGRSSRLGRVAALEAPIPCARELEDRVLPQVDSVVSAVHAALRR
jgi:acetoin:2,6-dichlorophenolindophenol oxidoreductase subunit beta